MAVVRSRQSKQLAWFGALERDACLKAAVSNLMLVEALVCGARLVKPLRFRRSGRRGFRSHRAQGMHAHMWLVAHVVGGGEGRGVSKSGISDRQGNSSVHGNRARLKIQMACRDRGTSRLDATRHAARGLLARQRLRRSLL